MKDTYTHEFLTQETIKVDRGHGPEEVTTTHRLFMPVLDNQGKDIGRAQFLGLGIRTAKGHDLYCQMDQVIA